MFAHAWPTNVLKSTTPVSQTKVSAYLLVSLLLLGLLTCGVSGVNQEHYFHFCGDTAIVLELMFNARFELLMASIIPFRHL